jgi:SAM-dependent methyltransferase
MWSRIMIVPEITTVDVPGTEHGTRWVAGQAMARYVLDNPRLTAPNGHALRVVDFGCGSGIVGIAAAMMGATVTCVDINPDAVHAARDNALANGVTLATASSVPADWDLLLTSGTLGFLSAVRVLSNNLPGFAGPGGAGYRAVRFAESNLYSAVPSGAPWTTQDIQTFEATCTDEPDATSATIYRPHPIRRIGA